MSPRLVLTLAALVGCGGGKVCGEVEGEPVAVVAADYEASVTEYDVYSGTWFIPSGDGVGGPGAIVSETWISTRGDRGDAYAWVPAPIGLSVEVTDEEVPHWGSAGLDGGPEDNAAVGGDVNADGRQDFVFAWRRGANDEHTIYLLSGPDGDGAVPATEIAYTSRGSQVEVVGLDIVHDIDGDGVDEVQVSVTERQGYVLLLPDLAEAPVEISMGDYLYSSLLPSDYPLSPVDAQYDIDGDGYVDVVGQDGGVFLGGADPVSSTATPYAFYPGNYDNPGGNWLEASSTQRVGDLNGDGRGDLVFGNDTAHEEQDGDGAVISSGEAYAWYGGAPGVYTWADADLVFTNDAAYTDYGTSWGVADADGSGYADVVIGYAGFGQYDPGDGLAVFLDPALGGCRTVPWNSAAVVVDEPDSTHHELGLEVGFLNNDGDGVLDVYASGITRHVEGGERRERVVYVYNLGGRL